MKELDMFGAFLMEHVRDVAIRHWEGIAEKHMYGWEDIFEYIKNNNDEDIIKYISRKSIDTAIHFLLSALDESGNVRVIVVGEDGGLIDMARVSDGLAGELYGKNGWIARFSSFTCENK